MSTVNLSKDFLAPYYAKKDNFPGLLSRMVYKGHYSRGGETWTDTIKRVVEGNVAEAPNVSIQEAEKLFHTMWSGFALPPGRGLWTGGVPNMPVGARYNCWACELRTVEDLCWTMTQLMLGGGVGVSLAKIQYINAVRAIPCEIQVICDQNHADRPKLEKFIQRPIRRVNALSSARTIVVKDSREGWVEAFRECVIAAFQSQSIVLDVSLVRAFGTALKTFGGTASGPMSLVDLICKTWDIIRNAAGRQLSSVEWLDIIDWIGVCVQSGNVRRSAIIVLGDPYDQDFRKAKQDRASVESHRWASNNSIMFQDMDQIRDFDWLKLVHDNRDFGDPGFLNLYLGRLTDPGVVAVNPCQPAWATVLTPEGIRTIGDISIGSTIWSGSKWTKVVAKWSTGQKQVNAYRTRAGTFYGTENHRVVSEGVKVEAQYAESIDVSVWPLEPEKVQTHDPKLIMDGLVLGDGTTHKATGRTFLIIGNDDHSYFNSEIASLIGEEAPTFKPGWWNVETSIETLPKTFERRVPEKYLRGTFLEKCSFLRGLYSANGSVCATRIQLKASSFHVIEAVQMMLSSIGIASYYTVNKPKEVEFSNGVYECKESYDLNIGTQQSRLRFAKLIGFIQPHKREAMMQLVERSFTNNGTRKQTFEITEVEPIGVEEVFDITVDSDEHTYWTGGMLVSNCGEQLLHHHEACNLAEVFPGNWTESTNASEVIRLMVRYCLRQRLAPLPDKLSDETRRMNMRVGLGMGGLCDFEWTESLLRDYYTTARTEANTYADELGVSRPITVTTVKPSGSISLLTGSNPGIHSPKGEYIIRRIRFNVGDPMIDVLKQAGVHCEPDVYSKEGRVVFAFPMRCRIASHAKVASQETVVEQINRQLAVQRSWVDNATSITVEYGDGEEQLLAQMLKTHAHEMKSCSFLRKENMYEQAPLEVIDSDTYLEMASKIDEEMTLDHHDAELEMETCEGGACGIDRVAV